MNNFTSIFEELSKLYEEDAKVEKNIRKQGNIEKEPGVKEALTEAAGAAEAEVFADDASAEEISVEEPDTEDEIKQLICECDKCGALVIKSEGDVVLDDESNLVNVEDECQFCEEAKGYKIVGVLAPYNAEDSAADEVPAEEVSEEAEEEFVEEGFLDNKSEAEETLA